MDLQYYRYFLAITEYQSISKAAEKLLLSQPYLSKVLARLEQELGVTLMDRSRLPIQLTADGECLRYYADQIVRLEEHMRGELSQARSKALPALTLGCPPFIESHVMPAAISKLAKAYPHTKFHLLSAPLSELMNQLKTETIQAVFALQHPVMSGALTTPVIQDRLLLVLPPVHPLYKPERAGTVSAPWFPWSALDKATFILSPLGSINRKSHDLLLSDLGIRPHIALESSSPEAMFSFAASGLGLTLLPETAICGIGHADQAEYIAIDHPLTYHSLVLAYYRSHSYLKQLVEALQEVYASRRLPIFPASGPQYELPSPPNYPPEEF